MTNHTIMIVAQLNSTSPPKKVIMTMTTIMMMTTSMNTMNTMNIMTIMNIMDTSLDTDITVTSMIMTIRNGIFFLQVEDIVSK